jgi:regulator of sigma E protease
MNFLWYLGSFALGLSLLIVVHEFGHYAVARRMGVKVLRFSVGFGPPLVMWRLGRDKTEWAIAAFPLGGYVKMLDEREAPVAAADLARAFNRQSVLRRSAIVVAGPLANLLLAVLFYWALYVYGVEELRPVMGSPVAGSVAAAAGITEGELVLSANGKLVATWQDLRMEILRQALDQQPLTLETVDAKQQVRARRLDLAGARTEDLEDDLLQRIGLQPFRPRLPAVIGTVTAGSPADWAGLRAGDLFTAVDGKPVGSWIDLVSAVRGAPGRPVRIEWLRDGRSFAHDVVPDPADENGRRIGRIGVAARDDGSSRQKMLTVIRYDPLRALLKATEQTWDTAAFSLSILGRMLTGDVSWKNLSGPVTIADYAGQSAQLGLSHYLRFLALISISLGVLNLLPIPILDGGHLMYYMVEIVTGGPVSERAMEIGQQIGLALLVLLMTFALYNDINRLLSG